MKKFMAILLAAALLVCLFAGCSKAEEDTGAFKLGLIGPFSGDAAVYGSAVRNGAQLAVEEINALGVLSFELNYQDDEDNTDKALQAYDSLKDWGMDILIGTATTTPCVSVSAKAYADRVFTLTPSASAAQITEGKDNIYQLCFNDPNQGTAAARYMADHLQDAKIAVIYDNSSTYSTGIYQNFISEAYALGLNVVSASTCTGETSDFSVQVADAKNAEADVLFLPMYYTPASMILTQADAVDYAPVFFGVDGMDGILTVEGFDTALAEGVMLLTPFTAEAKDEQTESFVAAYEAAYGEKPNQFAANAYDSIYAVYQALITSGITSEVETEELCLALMEQFDTMRFSGLTGGEMTWLNGQVDKMPTAVVIENGLYVSAEK